jgi:hypothetical protein
MKSTHGSLHFLISTFFVAQARGRSALALAPGQDKMIYGLVKSTLTTSEKGV